MQTDSPAKPGPEAGFTLIELFVVLLIVAALAGVALATFLGQQRKAYAASAEQLASEAEITAEEIATANGGRWGEGGRSFLSPTELHALEPAIPISSRAGGGGGAWVSEARAIEEGKGYELTVVSASNPQESFTVRRLADGSVQRSCAPVDPAGGCTGSW